MLRQMKFDPVIQKALRLAESRLTDDALHALDQAIKQDQDGAREADYHWLRGCVLEDRGDALNTICEKRDNYKSAIAAYRRAATLNPGMFFYPGNQRALVAMRPETTWAIPAYIQLLKHEEALVRHGAAQTLARIGRAAREASGPLESALSQEETNYHTDGAINPSGAMKAAIQRIRMSSREVEQARSSTRRIASKDRDIGNDVLPKLLADVQSLFVPVRGTYAHLRNVIGHSHCQSVAECRCRAIEALGRVEPDREKRILALVKSLWMDESAENRQMAAESLQRVDHELAVEAGVIGLGEEEGES